MGDDVGIAKICNYLLLLPLEELFDNSLHCIDYLRTFPLKQLWIIYNLE